ncbi:MAG: hypothetical protein U0835_21355 [Isosphaeraceae bacterium]
MNPEEEVFLSAYLDDALDPERRRRVESSLESDPRLAEHLRGLTAVRDLVAGLPRPSSPTDLSASVVARLQERPVLLPGRFGPGAARRMLAVLSTAALLLVAVTLALVASRVLRLGGAGRAPVEVAASGQPTPAPVVAQTPATTVAEPASKDVVAALPSPPGPDAAERLGDAEIEKVRRILDSPSLRKVFLLADVAPGETSRRVGDLLDQTPRKYATYLCITVDPEITVDPKHPGGASVYAVVMDDQELDRFRVTLRDAFPGKLVETDPNPAAVTQLADVGKVGIFTGTPVADVRVPEGPPLSLRSEPSKAIIPVKPRANRSSSTTGADLASGEVDAELAATLAGLSSEGVETPSVVVHAEASAPGGTTHPQFVGPPAPPRHRRPASVVLVWVSHSPGSRTANP